MTDLPTDPRFASWVSVSEAAEEAGVDTGTVRHWYRAGRIPTQRSEGERGAFLVPLDEVIALAKARGAVADDASPSEHDSEVTYWSLQAGAAQVEADLARQEAAQVRQRLLATEEQLEFLRAQLGEVSEESRNLREQLDAAAAQVDEARAQVDRLQKELQSGGSITDFSWLERAPVYQSPVRPQQRFPDDAVSELFASVQRDPEPPPPVAAVVEAPVHEPPPVAEDSETDLPDIPFLDTTTPIRPNYGSHEDDLFPDPDKKGRRRSD